MRIQTLQTGEDLWITKTLIKLEFDKIISMLENEAVLSAENNLPTAETGNGSYEDRFASGTDRRFYKIIKKGGFLSWRSSVEESQTTWDRRRSKYSGTSPHLPSSFQTLRKAKSRTAWHAGRSCRLSWYLFWRTWALTPLSNEIERCHFEDKTAMTQAKVKHIRRSNNSTTVFTQHFQV